MKPIRAYLFIVFIVFIILPQFAPAQVSSILNLQNKMTGNVPVATPATSSSNTTGKIYTCHFMLAFWDFIPKKLDWFRQMKAAGYNNIWGYADFYDAVVCTYNRRHYVAYANSKNKPPTGTKTDNSYWHYFDGQIIEDHPGQKNWDSTISYNVGQGYGRRIFQFLDTAYAAGMKVSIGCQGYQIGFLTAQFIANTYHHPAIGNYGGKEMYLFYNSGANQNQLSGCIGYLDSQTTIPRSSYSLVAYPSTYPNYAYWGNSPHWIDAYSTMPDYTKIMGRKNDTTTLDRLYFTRAPFLDGIINFSADKGGQGLRDNDAYNINYTRQNSYENQYASTYGAAHHKISIGGITAEYASAQYYNLGFRYVASQWQDILAMPVAQRPVGMCDVTANDYVELSYMSPSGSEKNGLLYFPPPNRGFTLGLKVRYPQPDHSGMAEFTKTYVKAYLQNLSAPVIESERIFYSYYLHPANPVLQKTVPEDLKHDTNLGKDSISRQSFWATTVFARGDSAAQVGQQVAIIKGNLYNQMDSIFCAVHLLKPGYIKINNTVSPLQQPGVRFFAIKQAMGTPYFAILNLDMSIRKSGYGIQAITNSSYPGGWVDIKREVK